MWTELPSMLVDSMALSWPRDWLSVGSITVNSAASTTAVVITDMSGLGALQERGIHAGIREAQIIGLWDKKTKRKYCARCRAELHRPGCCRYTVRLISCTPPLARSHLGKCRCAPLRRAIDYSRLLIGTVCLHALEKLHRYFY